jgi:hypothetical protein
MKGERCGARSDGLVEKRIEMAAAGMEGRQ